MITIVYFFFKNLGMSSIEWGDSILNCIQDMDSSNNTGSKKEKSFTKVLDISRPGKSDDSDSDFVIKQIQKRRKKVGCSPSIDDPNLLNSVEKGETVLGKVDDNIKPLLHDDNKIKEKDDRRDKVITTKHSPIQQSPTKDTTLLMSAWGLPDSVLQTYKKNGIESMFSWQRDCLSTGEVLNGGKC